MKSTSSRGPIRLSWRGLLGLILAGILLPGCYGGSPTDGSTATSLPAIRTPAALNTSPPEAGAGPEVTIDYTYYQIVGDTAAELRAQMDRLGPADETGRYDAYSHWYVSWTYSYATEGRGCVAESIQVSVTVTFTLPQWNVPGNAPADLVDRWEVYMAALQLHEDGHKEIAIEAGREILQTMLALPSYSSCSELEQAADAAGEGILEQYRQQQIEYDRITDHGATQGARFP